MSSAPESPEPEQAEQPAIPPPVGPVAAPPESPEAPVLPGPQPGGGLEKVGPGTAGLGGGTLVAIIASGLPEGIIKTVLIWFSPVSTVFFGILWQKIQELFRTFVVDARAMKDLIATRGVITKSLAYPGLPDNVRQEFLAARVRVEQMIIRLQLSKIPIHIRNA